MRAEGGLEAGRKTTHARARIAFASQRTGGIARHRRCIVDRPRRPKSGPRAGSAVDAAITIPMASSTRSRAASSYASWTLKSTSLRRQRITIARGRLSVLTVMEVRRSSARINRRGRSWEGQGPRPDARRCDASHPRKGRAHRALRYRPNGEAAIASTRRAPPETKSLAADDADNTLFPSEACETPRGLGCSLEGGFKFARQPRNTMMRTVLQSGPSATAAGTCRRAVDGQAIRFIGRCADGNRFIGRVAAQKLTEA